MTIGKKAVINGVLAGMATANSKFEKWSNGSWVCDYGVEGFMVAHVADALRKEQGPQESLLFEATFEEVREFSGAARPPGRPKNILQGRKRVDIALFDRRGRTVHVIEVKRSWGRRSCFRDIERLLALLNACAKQRNGSMKHGFLALPIVEWAETRGKVRAKIRSRASNIEQDVRSSFGLEGSALDPCLGGMNWYPKRYGGEGEWALSGLCLTFSS